MKALRAICLLIMLMMAPAWAFAAMPDISAGSTRLDFGTGCYILEGNVRVADRGRIMTADEAKVQIGSQKVWANGNVTLVQDGITFSCDSLFVKGQEKSADVRGNVNFNQEKVISIKADAAHFQWDTKLADFYGNVLVKAEGQKEQSYSHVQYNVPEQRLILAETGDVAIPEIDMSMTPEAAGIIPFLP